MTEVELINLADDLGNSVVLRITGRDAHGLNGIIEVGSYFVSGTLKTRVTSEDLKEWETVLDSLAQEDTASWREGQRAPEIHLETEDDRVTIAVVDSHAYMVTAELTIEVADDWLKTHHELLATVRKSHPDLP